LHVFLIGSTSLCGAVLLFLLSFCSYFRLSFRHCGTSSTASSQLALSCFFKASGSERPAGLERAGPYREPSRLVGGAPAVFASPSYLSGWSPALSRATISFTEDSPKGLRRVSKPTSRSSKLCVLLTYWFKPLYKHRVQ
jgi:hypothetical protein